MAYPTVLSVVGCASLVAILTFVVPRLKPALETADVSGFVRFLFACSDALRTPQGWAVVAIVAAVTVVIMLRWGSVLLGAFGPYRSFLAARREYAAIAGLRFLAAAHVPLPDAMEAMAACERDTAQRNVLRDAAASLSRGEPFSDIVRRMRLFGAFFASVAGAGYASGSLADALSAAQEEARQRMEKALAVLCAVVEPAVLTVIGVCVGGAVIALLLPLLDAAQRAY
jgi:general secretion pathway protein F